MFARLVKEYWRKLVGFRVEFDYPFKIFMYDVLPTFLSPTTSKVFSSTFAVECYFKFKDASDQTFHEFCLFYIINEYNLL